MKIGKKYDFKHNKYTMKVRITPADNDWLKYHKHKSQTVARFLEEILRKYRK